MNKRGVSLIEIMFVIVIFGVGIITIFSVVIRNLYLIERIKLKTTSTSLAKEGIEIVYNMRDSNLEKVLKWNCIYTSSLPPEQRYTCQDTYQFTGGANYQVSLQSLTGSYLVQSTLSTGFEDNRLYYHTGFIKDAGGVGLLTGFWYNYISGSDGQPTNYSRYIRFDEVYLQGDSGMGDGRYILKLTSVVKYQKAGQQGETLLESFIGKTR